MIAEREQEQAVGLRQNKSFWLLLVSQAASVMGDQCWFVALPWLVLELSGSSMSAGVTRALEYVPYLLFSLIAGALLDRYNRRRMLVTIEIGRTITLLAIPFLALLGILETWQIFLLAFVLSSLDVFFNVGLLSVVPSIVPREHLTKANSYMESVFSLTAILGLPLMGALVGVIGAPAVLGLDGLSFLFSLAVLLILRFPSPAPRETRLSFRALSSDIGAGLGFIWHHRVMRSIALLNFLGNLANSSLLILSIVYLKEVLHLPAEVLGIVLALSAFGTFLGASNNPRIVKRLGHGNTVVLGFVLGVIPFIFYCFSDNWLLLGVGQFTFGLALILINTNTNVIRQTLVPPEMMGRVTGAASTLARFSLPLGYFGAGLLAEIKGVENVLLIGLGLRLVLIGVAGFSPLRNFWIKK
ncbi:MAG TPA: MFS transporter [Chloroflexia bacterium]|nr:MFS transporter [Chloroflexia bacterium]